MIEAIEVQDDLPGWLISAARGACALSYRELCAEAGVAMSWVVRIEKLEAIVLRHERGRGAEGIDPASMARLLATFRKHGLELRGAAAGHPAMLVCVDPLALQARRAAEFEGRAAARSGDDPAE